VPLPFCGKPVDEGGKLTAALRLLALRATNLA